MSDPLSPPRRPARRRLEANEQGTAPAAANGHGNGATKHGPIFTAANLLGADKSFVFTWNDLPLTIRYNPNRLTYRVAREMDALISPEDGGEPDPSWLIKRLLTLVTGWDMVMDPETLAPYPLTTAGLEELPTPFLFALLRAVNEAINPPEPSSSSSSFS